VLFDWNNWWAIDNAVGPIEHKEYVATVRKHYRVFHRRNIAVDVVFSDSELSRYDLVIAPMLHMVKAGVAERIQAQVEAGGTFVATVFSGVVDETDLAFEGYPGPLRPLLGIWIEEIDALYEGQVNHIVSSKRSDECSRLCEIVRPEGAEVMATFGDDFYAGSPAVTRNRVGRGQAYYIATDAGEAFLDGFYGSLLDEHGIRPPLHTPPGVEVAERTAADGRRLLFVLNHNAVGVRVHLSSSFQNLLTDAPTSGTLELRATDVAILTDA
jgi:beta-galactosidase